MEEIDIDLSPINTLDAEEFIDDTISILMENLREDFSKEFRDSYLNVQLDEQTFKIKINELFLSLHLILSRLVIDDYNITESDFVRDIKSIKKTIKDYFDFNIINKGNTDIKDITEGFLVVMGKIHKNAWEVNIIKGNSVNIYDIIHIAENNKEVEEILNFISNENAQFQQIEESVENAANRLIEILSNEIDKDNCYKNLISSISSKQFQQVFVNISLKPDLFGNIIEKPINTSFLRGMRNSTDYFINASGARKALVTNSTQVRIAGYLARKLALLCINTRLNKDVEDCGSDNLLEIEINKENSSRFKNRYYKLKHSDKEFKFTTNARSTKKLIGKKVLFASPITCGCEKGICKRCYGRLSDINQYHAGISAILKLTEQFIQILLSSKHLLRVIADLIELPLDFSDFFKVDKNTLIATRVCQIQIDEFEFNETTDQKFISKLTIQDSNENIYEITDISDLELCLASGDVPEEGIIQIEEGDEVFKITVENNELSAPLKKFLRINESEEELNSFNGISDLITTLVDLLIKSNIDISSTGIELIIRELARNPDDIQKRTNDMNNVHFLRLTNALLNSPSAAVSMAFERHRYLFENNIFWKDEESIIDNIF